MTEEIKLELEEEPEETIVPEFSEQAEEDAGPKKHRIKTEPLLSIRDGHLVLTVDHVFDDIPSWVEWDPAQEMFTISHMNGDKTDVKLFVNKENFDLLRKHKKLLLISRVSEDDRTRGIPHFIPFIDKTH